MDIQYLLFLQGLRESAPAFVNQTLLMISEFVVSKYLIIFLMLIYWCVNKRAGLYLIVCQMGASSLNQTVKNTFCIYRPWIRDPRVQVAASAAASATGYSFPSGHTTIAVATYGGIAMWQRKHKWIIAPMVLMTLLTGFARNWLCAHTPQDVIVALLLATAFIFAAAKVMQWVDAHPEKITMVLIIGLVIMALQVLYVQLRPYPMDYLADGSLLVDPYKMQTDCFVNYGTMIGVLIGWFIEKKFINFTVDGSWLVRALRLIIGTIGLLAMQSYVLPVFGSTLGKHWGYLLGYALMLIYITAIYPAIFNAVEKHLPKKAEAEKPKA